MKMESASVAMAKIFYQSAHPDELAEGRYAHILPQEHPGTTCPQMVFVHAEILDVPAPAIEGLLGVGGLHAPDEKPFLHILQMMECFAQLGHTLFGKECIAVFVSALADILEYLADMKRT